MVFDTYCTCKPSCTVRSLLCNLVVSDSVLLHSVLVSSAIGPGCEKMFSHMSSENFFTAWGYSSE